jgi:RNA repair, ligase-Pnkp-associating, region of Hen1/PNKP adenylyltransferase domain, C-terminal region
MLLTLTLTRAPATDLGFLLHKHPDREQEFALPFGAAHVFYPEVGEERCTAALLLDVDPVGLIRRGVRFARLDQYVNDRPYVASSFVSVALSRVFNTALGGRCSARPELPEELLPNLDRLRRRSLGAKRSLAVREFALGIEALERFVREEPLRRVHECCFGVLALESEPVDPRL